MYHLSLDSIQSHGSSWRVIDTKTHSIDLSAAASATSITATKVPEAEQGPHGTRGGKAHTLSVNGTHIMGSQKWF